MKRYYFSASLALAVVVVLGLAGPVSAGDQVPFKGTFEGDVTHTPVDAQTDAVLVEAAGDATQLGQFTLDIPHFVNRPTRIAAGYYEFTAANGDTVSAEFTGLAMPTSTPGVLYIVEVATITGGTGRFAGATGSFVTERWFDTINLTTIGYFEGTISSPGR
jgi:hypothetical protein